MTTWDKFNRYKLVIAALQAHGQLTTASLSEITGIKRSTLKNYLYEMRQYGEVRMESTQWANGFSTNMWMLGMDLNYQPAVKEEKTPSTKRKTCAWHEVPRASGWGGYMEGVR